MTERIVREEKGEYCSKDTSILDIDCLKGLGQETIEVLKELIKEENYPKRIAEKLDVHEQKVYYHINKLKEMGLIEMSKKERSRGAICKFYRAKSTSFSFTLDDDWEKVKLGQRSPSGKISSFFEDFVSDKTFQGSIVVGSPKEHGPFLTSARDGHYAVQLGVFLGDFCDLEKRFIVKLDTEVKAEEAHDRNLILIGGPIANTVSRDLNESLEVRFNWEDQWKIVSDVTGKEYTGDNIGLIAKVKNNGYSRLLLSGLHHKGTKSCIIALTQYYEQILEDYRSEKDFYRVIRGLDKDGDGKTDSIEVLE